MRMNEPVTQLQIHQRVFDLHDEYCHGGIDRRKFRTDARLPGASGRSQNRNEDAFDHAVFSLNPAATHMRRTSAAV